MPIKLTQSESAQTYFCTFTCKNWLHLFEITNLYDSIYKWFEILTNKGNEIEGFVIMPNYLHLLIFVNYNENVNLLLANGKRFLAYEIIKRLEFKKEHVILHQLELAVTEKERQRKKKHRVFEVSSDIKPCYTEKFLLQKLNYIHNDPTASKWKLAKLSEEYFDSSACFYILNCEHKFVRLTHWKDVGEHLAHRPLRRATVYPHLHKV
jgi:REP element-mobilizing transposase RayT